MYLYQDPKRLRRMLYDARYAQQQYEQMLSESRKGISLTEQELNRINETITPLLKKGQSLPVICERYRDELPISDAAMQNMRNICARIQMPWSARWTAWFREALGDEKFRMLFQVIITDCGSEFSDPEKIEADMETGEIQCRIFHCDLMNTNQKSNCERNHELIRYIIPKNHAKDEYTEDEIREMMNHINSYPRKKWNGQAPIDLFIKIYGQETANLLGLEKIPSDSITLTPALFKK